MAMASVDREKQALCERFGRRFSCLGESLYRIDLGVCILEVFLPNGYPERTLPEVTLTWNEKEDEKDPLFLSSDLEEQMRHMWESSERLPVVVDVVEWIEELLTEGDESKDDGEDDLDIKPDPHRPLVIYTWGDKVQKGPPRESEKNFNAKCLNCRGGAIDLRRMNGTWPILQAKVKSCSTFGFFVNAFIKTVEREDLKVVSVNCSKGRHRCVSFAEVIREYYPLLVVHHLSLKVTTSSDNLCLRTRNR